MLLRTTYIFLTSFFGRLGFGWLLKQNECSLFRALNERNGFASLSFGYQNQMASTADSLLFLAASPHASWHDHGVGSEFIETFVLTGGNTVSHPAFLSGEEKWPTTLESAVVMDTMESSAGLLGPTVRGTPRSSQVWGQSFRSEFPPTSRAPEMDEHCRRPCLLWTRVLSHVQLCRHIRLLPSGTVCWSLHELLLLACQKASAGLDGREQSWRGGWTLHEERTKPMREQQQQQKTKQTLQQTWWGMSRWTWMRWA